MKKLRSGQGTLEYVIILAAVVGAIIMVASMLKGKMSDKGAAYDTLSTTMGDKIGKVDF